MLAIFPPLISKATISRRLAALKISPNYHIPGNNDWARKAIYLPLIK
jgi:hypothetical protein